MKHLVTRFLLVGTLIGNLAAATTDTSTKVANCDDAAAMVAASRYVDAARSDGRGCDVSAARVGPPLRWSDRLGRVARRQADELAAQRRLVHRDRSDRPLAARLATDGYALGHAVENVAFGYPTAEAVVAAWRASASHCANLTDAAVTELGLACADRDGIRYWVLVLGAPAPDARRAEAGR